MTGLSDWLAGRAWRGWRVLMWGGAALLLLTPALAMQFFAEVQWDGADFAVMGVMLLAACSACELAARASADGSYRLAALIGIGTMFLTVWTNLAVGMIGSEDNGFNLLFGGVLALVLVGAMLVRFKARGLALVMVAAAIAQAAIGGAGYGADPRGAIFSMAFALPWLSSAALFWNAGRTAG